MLEVKNIKKNFGDTEVLKGLDFSLEKGEVLAIIGSSGSGKTTLLRCLNFLESPDEGQITVNGETLFDSNAYAVPSEEEIRKRGCTLDWCSSPSTFSPSIPRCRT